jgi:Peptidase family M1 domain
MFANKNALLWEKGAFYVKRAVEFYSEHVGEYPWPQATAVHSALSAGGGMEYPMITVIGNNMSAISLDQVITHEVGHNWFQGILASNERDHPFMDEGLNSYYEYRYLKRYWPKNQYIDLPKKLFDPSKQGDILGIGQLLLAKEHVDLPPDSHADRFREMGYGLQVYVKSGKTLQWLEQYLGTDSFDRAMQAYFTRWKFKHPYPEDLEKCFQDNTEKKTNWWFELMQSAKQADYTLAKTSPMGVSLQNKGNLEAPVPVAIVKDGAVLRSKWYEGKPLPDFQKGPGESYVVDPTFLTLDVNRRNNYAKRPLSLRLFSPILRPSARTLSILPWMGWNNVDKTQFGVLLYHSFLPSNALQVYLAPGVGTASKRLTGVADIRYKVFPGGAVPKITFGLSAKTFSFTQNPTLGYYSQMYRFVPQARIELADRSTSFQHWVQFRSVIVNRQFPQFDSSAYIGQTWKNNPIYELRYQARQKRGPNPWEFNVILEQQAFKDGFERDARYWKSSIEWRQQFFYAEKKKVLARLFAGYFIQSTQRNRGSIDETALSLHPQGFNDYKYDQVFLARDGGSGILGRQVSQGQGGFKAAFGEPFAGVIGNSNNYILALNLKADLPQRLPLGIPLKPYFDLGYFDDATPLGKDRPRNEQLLWSGGLLLDFFKGGFEIYFPLVNSKTLKDR